MVVALWARARSEHNVVTHSSAEEYAVRILPLLFYFKLTTIIFAVLLSPPTFSHTALILLPKCVFGGMINSWRDAWTGIGDFPFMWAQLAPYTGAFRSGISLAPCAG